MVHEQDTTFLTRSQIAEILSISEHKAGELMHEMPCLVLPGGRKRVSMEDFTRWAESHKVYPVSKPRNHNRPIKTENRIRRRTA